MIFETVTPRRFNHYLKKSKRIEFLTVYPEVTLKKWRLFLTLPTRGGAGFAITFNYELANLFNNTGIKGLGRSMVQWAIDLGACKVFCFNGFPRVYFESFGFHVVRVLSWDDKLAPANWDYKKYGEPDVVYMERRGNCLITKGGK